jgi:hypothetical protein
LRRLENISSVSDSLAKSSPHANAKDKVNGDDGSVVSETLLGSPTDDGSFICDHCNEGNSELMPDHLCTQCGRHTSGKRKAARTEVEGRNRPVTGLAWRASA